MEGNLTPEQEREIYDPLERDDPPAFSPEYAAELDRRLAARKAEREKKGEALPKEEPRPSTLYPDYD